METDELIAAFRVQLDAVEASGGQQLPVVAIREYLAVLEHDAGKTQEYRNREHAGLLAQYSAKSQLGVEMLKAVIEAGKSALQYLIVINGGAVIALLGVLSNLAGKNAAAPLARYLALPMLQFGIGVMAGAVGFAFRYLSQACFAESAVIEDKYFRWGERLRYAAIACAILGFCAFGTALVNSYHAVGWSFGARS